MTHGPYVPAEIMKRYIVMWLASTPQSNYSHVAWVTGINARTIHDIIYGKRATVRFDTADAILTRLGYIEAWINDAELAPFYAVA